MSQRKRILVIISIPIFVGVASSGNGLPTILIVLWWLYLASRNKNPSKFL